MSGIIAASKISFLNCFISSEDILATVPMRAILSSKSIVLLMVAAAPIETPIVARVPVIPLNALSTVAAVFKNPAPNCFPAAATLLNPGEKVSLRKSSMPAFSPVLIVFRVSFYGCILLNYATVSTHST